MADFDVVELPETDHVDVGDVAPNFTRPLVTADYWEDVTLSDFTDDGPVLLVCYPMDGTGIAKSTWITIRDRGWGIDDGLTVVGLSISSPYEHTSFIDRHRLPYALFSDPSNQIAETYGIVHDHHGMTGIRGARSAFYLFDSDRTVVYAWVASEWPEDRPYDDVAAAIDPYRESS